jgi:FolB domain-containing protein
MGKDQIHIKDLLLRGILGINDSERENEQDILINIILFGDLKPAGVSDKIDDTINYRTITKQIIAHVQTSKRFTVEALAQDVADMCLQAGGVERVIVRIEKPGALRFARSVGVEIERSRADLA